MCNLHLEGILFIQIDNIDYYYSQIDLEIDNESFDYNIEDVDYIKNLFETIKSYLLEKFNEKWREYIVEILLRYHSNDLISG